MSKSKYKVLRGLSCDDCIADDEGIDCFEFSKARGREGLPDCDEGFIYVAEPEKMFIIGSVDAGRITSDPEVARTLGKAHGLSVNELKVLDSATVVEGRHFKVRYRESLDDQQRLYIMDNFPKYNFSEEWTGLEPQVDMHMSFFRLPISLKDAKAWKSELEVLINDVYKDIKFLHTSHNGMLKDALIEFLKEKGK